MTLVLFLGDRCFFLVRIKRQIFVKLYLVDTWDLGPEAKY